VKTLKLAMNVPEWLSTHPASDKRSELFDRLLPKVCPKLLYSHWTETKQENFKSKTFLFIRGSNNRTCEMAFQRRRLKCEKLTDAGCQVMAKAHIAFGKVS
jgi:hypothetical protein